MGIELFMSYKTRALALVFYKYFSSKTQGLSLRNDSKQAGVPARSWEVGKTEQNGNWNRVNPRANARDLL